MRVGLDATDCRVGLRSRRPSWAVRRMAGTRSGESARSISGRPDAAHAFLEVLRSGHASFKLTISVNSLNLHPFREEISSTGKRGRVLQSHAAV